VRNALALVVVAAVAATALYLRPWDTRLSADEAERALAVRVGGGARFECAREENDGSIALDDVDYFCQRVDAPAESAYWIGTDDDGITETQPAG
jgi:hypothetical protein